MAVWAKVKFFWQTMLGSAGSTLTATTTETGYDVANIYNMREVDFWKATTVNLQEFHYDAGFGNTKDADYLCILGHNLSSISAGIALSWSPTGDWSGEETDIFSGYVTSDTVYLKEFTAPGGKRYWRLRIWGIMTAAPYMAICIWGLKTELDYVNSSFAPDAEEVKAITSVTQGGYVSGVHQKYSVRKFTLNFNAADADLYAKITDWWNGSGLKNFFVAWETANNPEDVYLMRPETTFNNPLSQLGAYRNINVALTGRKE